MANSIEKIDSSSNSVETINTVDFEYNLQFDNSGYKYISEPSSRTDENEMNYFRLNKLKNDFSTKLLSLLLEEDFEYGVENKTDILIREQMNYNSIATKSWINTLFIDNFDKSDILIGILRLIARIEYLSIAPEGPIMAIAALSHLDIQVKECGIRAYESWGSLESLKILENLNVQPDWLQSYANDVVLDLREELNAISG